MAAGADTRRSFFTNQLANRLDKEGVEVPPYILDLLDKPFVAFTDEDRAVYEKQVKGKELLILFARLLGGIYESSGESARHSWRGMCHLLKDSPIKVCVSYVMQRDEGSGESEKRSARPAAAGGSGPEPGRAGADTSRRSFFTKKLERKLDERGIKVPASIISMLDKPFAEFTPEDRETYETEFKGRQLTILFSDILDELYEETGRVSSGWNAMCRYLKETPMKLIATYVVQEEERLEEMAAPPEQEDADRPVREKLNVRPYQPARGEGKEQASRRRRK